MIKKYKLKFAAALFALALMVGGAITLLATPAPVAADAAVGVSFSAVRSGDYISYFEISGVDKLNYKPSTGIPVGSFDWTYIYIYEGEYSNYYSIPGGIDVVFTESIQFSSDFRYVFDFRDYDFLTVGTRYSIFLRYSPADDYSSILSVGFPFVYRSNFIDYFNFEFYTDDDGAFIGYSHDRINTDVIKFHSFAGTSIFDILSDFRHYDEKTYNYVDIHEYVFFNGIPDIPFSLYFVFNPYPFDSDTATLFWNMGSYSVGAVAPDNRIGLPPAPEKLGHDFVGWYYDEALTDRYDGWPITEDSVFYPKWTPAFYTIIFDSNVFGVSVPNQVVEYPALVTLPDNPVHDGYNFTGWFIDSACSIPFDFDTVVIENTTLYAGWELRYLQVTFFVRGAVYATVSVPWGSTLSQAVTAAQTQTAVVTGIYADSSYHKAISTSAVLTSDMDVYAELSEGVEPDTNVFASVKKWMGDNWVYLVLAAAGLSASVLLYVLTKKRRRSW